MASFVSSVKFSNHSRSISLPTSSHPILGESEKHLRRLKSSEGASSMSYASKSQKLDSLRNMYDCLEDMFQLPRTQQLLSKSRDGTWDEEILDGSLRLLDICHTARDTYSMMKECVQELESCLRRKRGANLDNEIDVYMATKKKLNKVICKCYKELRSSEKRCSIEAVDDNMAAQLIKKIKEAQELSQILLQSIINFISEPQTKSWSLVSMLLYQNKGEDEVSEVRSLEVELLLLVNRRHIKVSDLVRDRNLVERVRASGESIQDTVDVLEVILKILLKSRGSLLNILNN